MPVDSGRLAGATLAFEEMALRELDARANARLTQLFPEFGPLARRGYPKHLEFFEAGKGHRQRGFIAANRVGKSEAGGFEMGLHLTGAYDEYAPWWNGRRFTGPISSWVAGDTAQTVRDILQAKLIGPPNAPGTGIIPPHLIHSTTGRQGVPGAVETLWIKHVSGGLSQVVFKSFDQRRKSFQGTAQHVIWLDEECPEDIYDECLLRTMIVPGTDDGGMLMLTFTPLMGLTPVVLRFMPGGERLEGSVDGKHTTFCTWDDAPHLTDDAKSELIKAMPPHQRDARSKGIPQLGAGAIYPVEESFITVTWDQIPGGRIPDHWPRAYGLDVGWNWTAAVWEARDPDSGTRYIYDVYKRGYAEPSVHAAAIRDRGPWIPGVIDPAAQGRSQADGSQLIEKYKALGLDLETAPNAVESGLYETYNLLSTGRLKVLSTCKAWFEEYRIYRRDEKGRVVKQNDHLMDPTRYRVLMGLDRMKAVPVEESPFGNTVEIFDSGARSGLGWMGL